MPSVADIFGSVHLDLETGTFEVDAQRFAEAAGAKAGQSMSSAIGSRLKGLAWSAIGAGVGAAAGMALSGANELDAATRQLQADTGMTATEAAVAEKAIAGMYRNNLQGFDQIGAAMGAVINGLGLTGQAAVDATQQFLAFSTATGQDAAEAVTAIKGDLDAWNLAAAAAGPLMDKLVVSHQKYGVSITADEAALKAMAPAMQAANMSIDDGIALLNLFQMAGVDAAKAPVALRTAVAQLKPGQNLNDLIARISAIEDPTLRAQEAMKVFGARVGVQMAQAIKPGMDSLATITASLGDTTDATTKADNAIKAGFGEQAVLILHNFKGALSDVATELGTTSDAALVAAAVLGPKLTKAFLAIGGALVPQLAKGFVSGAGVMDWMTTGTKITALMSAGVTLAIPAAAAAAVLLWWSSINDDLNKQAGAIETQTTQFVTSATTAQLKVSQAAIVKGINDIANSPLGMTLWGDQLASLQRDYATVTAQIEQQQQAITNAFRQGERGDVSSAQQAGAAAVAAFADGARANINLADQAGIDASVAFGKGAASMQSSIAKDGQTLLDAWLHPINLAGVKTELAGALHAKALVDGLNAGDPAVRGAAEQEAINILTYLDALKGPAFVAGQNAVWSLASGLEAAGKDLPGTFGTLVRGALQGAVGQIYSIWPTYQQQVAKIAVSPGTIAGNNDLAAAIKQLGGGLDYTAGKAAGLSDTLKTQLTDAFDAAKTKATTFFDDLHNRNLKAIADTRDLANAQIDGQIKAVNAEVQAAKDKLQAERDARQEASLRAALAAAPTDVSAQHNLSDFLEQQNITEMERAAAAKVDALDAQKTSNDTLATTQTTAENARYKAQVAAFDKELKALQTQLDKHPAAWAKMNAEVLKVLDDAGVKYTAAGVKQGAAYIAGLKLATGGLINLPSVAAGPSVGQAPKYTAAPPATVGATATLALAPGAERIVLENHLYLNGREVVRWMDEELARIRRP